MNRSTPNSAGAPFWCKSRGAWHLSAYRLQLLQNFCETTGDLFVLAAIVGQKYAHHSRPDIAGFLKRLAPMRSF